jgi:HEAT repeat protein/predicted MFS family arabinose efflux permease
MAAGLSHDTPTEATPRGLNRLEILRGLRLSTWDASFSTIHSTLTTGAFLTGFALWLGAGSLTMGLLSAIPTFAGLVQIVASYFSERREERRQFTAWLSTSGRLLWLLILLLPILLPRRETLIPFLFLFALSFALLNAVMPAWMSWMSDLVPPDNRGAYFARRNMVAGITGMVIGLPAAWFLDVTTRQHHWETLGFGTLFAIAAFSGVASFACLMRQPEPPRSALSGEAKPHGLRGVLTTYRAPFADRNFRSLMAFNAVISTGQFFAAPFFNVYALEKLHLGYTWLQFYAIVTGVASLLSMPLWGFLSDRVGNRPLLAIGVVGVFTIPILWVFTTPAHPVLTLLLLIVINTASGLFWSGVSLPQFNLLINSCPSEKTSVYVATMAAVTGLAGGIAPLIGGVVMNALHGWQGQMFGIRLGDFQLVFLVAAFLRLLSLPFLRSVSEARSVSTLDVLQQLSRARPRAWLHIRRLQGGGDEEVRLRATEALGETRTQLAASELQAALADPSPDVRQEAARALGTIGDAGSVAALVTALNDPAVEVMEEAIHSLGQIRDRQASPALIALLQNPTGPHPRRLRSAAARALGALGGPKAADALLEIVQTCPDEALQEAAIRSLGEIGERRAVPVLTALLVASDSPSGLRLALIRSLGMLGDTSALDALRALLDAEDSDPAMLPSLADALARLKDTDSALPLIARLETLDSPLALKQTAYAIGMLLDAGASAYALLSRDDFARDAAVGRMISEMQRSLRNNPHCESLLRAALDAYTEGNCREFCCALEHVSRTVPLTTGQYDHIRHDSPLRQTLLYLAESSTAQTSIETALLALAALHRLIEATVIP